MKLSDFLQDEGLNNLRKRMQATELGTFELFDATRQLTWSEREALAEQGLEISSSDLRVLKDKTLAYKNSRVWIMRDQFYHLASCPIMQAVRHRQMPLDVGTGEWPKRKEGGVCLECLAVLQFQGFDTRRLRRTEFSEQISEHFSLAEFTKDYPFYPII